MGSQVQSVLQAQMVFLVQMALQETQVILDQSAELGQMVLQVFQVQAVLMEHQASLALLNLKLETVTQLCFYR